MKKALVLALTAFMVLSLATAAFAVEVSYEGKVAVKWSNEGVDLDPDPESEKLSDGFAKDALEAKVTIDFTKDYGDGVTAGVVTIVEAHADDDNGLVFDGAGWIQLERDLFTLKASTEIDDGVGRDLGQFNIAGAPGLGLTLNLIDGLTINSVLNGGSDYNYLVKGEFAQDLFTLGGGYQNSYNTDDTATQSAIGVYGTLNLIDGLAINAEYGKRDKDVDNENDDPISAILATATYDWNALSAKAGFLKQAATFESVDADDVDDEDWRINEQARVTGKIQDKPYNVTVLFADASYALTDALTVKGYFDYLLGVTDGPDEDELAEEDEEALEKLSYRVGAAYTLGDWTFDGWYRAYTISEIGGKATYALADGVDTSFEVGYKMYDDDNTDDKVVYTAKIEAAF